MIQLVTMFDECFSITFFTYFSKLVVYISSRKNLSEEVSNLLARNKKYYIDNISKIFYEDK